MSTKKERFLIEKYIELARICEDKKQAQYYIDKAYSHIEDYENNNYLEVDNSLIDASEVNTWLDEVKPARVCVQLIWCEAMGEKSKPSRTYSNEIVRLMDNNEEYVRSGQLRFQRYGKQQGWIRRLQNESNGD